MVYHGMASCVYVLHFDERYPAGRRPQHYVGVSVVTSLADRMRQHRTGNNGKKGSLMRALAAKGIGFQVVSVKGFPTAREAFDHERMLKRRRAHWRLCVMCKGVEVKA